MKRAACVGCGMCAPRHRHPFGGHEIVVRAADIYAALKARGEPIGDADILNAATALGHGLAVVTNNEDHFRRISGLHVENWLTA